MSNPAGSYIGIYSYIPLPISKLESKAKRRYLFAEQTGKAVLDYELSEISYRSFDFIRRFLESNIGDGAIGINSWSVSQSVVTTVSNFTVTGGSADQPAMLIVKGYPLLLFGSIEYNQQGTSGTLEDDNYTTTVIPTISVPGSDRIDTVYVDTYLAEVSSEAGSEYHDTTIKDATLNVQSANRFRIVQDVLVAEGTTSIPVDGLDANSVYHRYYKLAEIHRHSGNPNILAADIVDFRQVIPQIGNFSIDSYGNVLYNGIMINTGEYVYLNASLNSGAWFDLDVSLTWDSFVVVAAMVQRNTTHTTSDCFIPLPYNDGTNIARYTVEQYTSSPFNMRINVYITGALFPTSPQWRFVLKKINIEKVFNNVGVETTWQATNIS